MELEHITEMINVKVLKGETYNDLFEKVIKLFPGDKEKRKACEDWVAFNKGANDKDFNKEVVTDQEYLYASFNLKQ
jgi:hypothetical protein